MVQQHRLERPEIQKTENEEGKLTCTEEKEQCFQPLKDALNFWNMALLEQYEAEKADTVYTEVPTCRFTCTKFVRILAFEPRDQPSAEETLADPYFKNIANVDREPSAQPVTKLEFEFERRRVTKEGIRKLIYREILEYHPNMLREFLDGTESSGFKYPEHYAKGSTGTPPDRSSVIYSDNQPQSTANITADLSKCLIRENVEKTQEHSASVGAHKFPRDVSQELLQGPVKRLVQLCNRTPVQHLLLSKQHEQRKVDRHPAIAPNNVPCEVRTEEEARPVRVRQGMLKGST
ncbi:hypothetical protein ACP4OV_015809 [Aristida adscensionis]